MQGDLVEGPDEVNLRKTVQPESWKVVLKVGDGVAVRDGCGVWARDSRHMVASRQRTGGKAQDLEDGRIIPSSVMCSDSALAAARRSCRRQTTSTGVHRSTVGWWVMFDGVLYRNSCRVGAGKGKTKGGLLQAREPLSGWQTGGQQRRGRS